MIKLNSSGTAPDYTEHGSVSTDCITVGQFMTEAAAIYNGNLTFIVDGCRYDICDNPKLRVVDNTPIDEVYYAISPLSTTFIVKVKPHPKTVTRHGWVNLYHRGWIDGIIPGGKIFKTEEEAASSFDISVECEKLATVRVVWEEVTE